MVSYGVTSRVATKAIESARKKGLKVGHLRFVVVWPLPEKLITELAGKVKAIVFPEVNMGQVVLEVERLARGQCEVIPVTHPGGGVHKPEVIEKAILEAAK